MAIRRFEYDHHTFACSIERVESPIILTGAPASGKSNTVALFTGQIIPAYTPALFDLEGDSLCLLSSSQSDEQALLDTWNALQSVPAYIERDQRAREGQVRA